MKVHVHIHFKLTKIIKPLSYRRGTARRTMLIELLSAAAQLYEKLYLKKLEVGE